MIIHRFTEVTEVYLQFQEIATTDRTTNQPTNGQTQGLSVFDLRGVPLPYVG